ncbi:hypothetical protein J5690_08225 [bacterium]|nr:hypothetical protein [bacterium]
MNALNRFGCFICSICMFSLVELVGKNFIEGYQLVILRGGAKYFEMAPYFVFLIIIFDLTLSELRITRFCFFYTESFFDRNWYVFIQSAFMLYLFKEHWQIVASIAIFVLIVNDVFRRWRTKKQMIVIENLKKLSFYPDFDATKFKFKHYQKNFFLRSWPMFVIPWALIVVTNSVLRGFLSLGMTIAFFIFEIVSKYKALKEMDEVVNTENMI